MRRQATPTEIREGPGHPPGDPGRGVRPGPGSISDQARSAAPDPRTGNGEAPEWGASRSAARWRPGTSHHLRRGQGSALGERGPRFPPRPLPDGPARPRRDPCYSEPKTAQRVSQGRRNGQPPQHQTYPQQAKPNHEHTGFRGVWCVVPMVGPGRRGASRHASAWFAREAADRTKNQSTSGKPAGPRNGGRRGQIPGNRDYAGTWGGRSTEKAAEAKPAR